MYSEEPVHDSDQESIDVNKSKLEDNISNLLVLIFGISIAAWIIQVIRLFQLTFSNVDIMFM